MSCCFLKRCNRLESSIKYIISCFTYYKVVCSVACILLYYEILNHILNGKTLWRCGLIQDHGELHLVDALRAGEQRPLGRPGPGHHHPSLRNPELFFVDPGGGDIQIVEGSFLAVSKPILQWQVNFAVFFENFKIATLSHRFKHSMYRLSYHFAKSRRIFQM